MHYKKTKLLLSLFVIFAFSCNDNSSEPVNDLIPPSPTPLLSFNITGTFPHDTSLYTEGLFVHNGHLFESTGSPNDLPWLRSLIGTIDTTTGKMKIRAELDKSVYFGEGTVILGDRLYQLTYKNKKGFVYDASSFRLIDSFTYANQEGWGLTTDGKELIMSDGTSALTFIDPSTMAPTKVIHVSEYGAPFVKLNELEFINGHIYANVYTTNQIVKIDPSNGVVVGRLDLSTLTRDAAAVNPKLELLNGIAYDSTKGAIYVTGKLWPLIYQIELR